MDCTIVVATFGSDSWVDLARQRAVPSAEQFGIPVVHVHAASLHKARNEGLSSVDTEWVCHLDADDELESGYFEKIAAGIADLRAPAVRYIRRPRTCPPARVPRVAGHTHACKAECLTDGNWLVVGTVARTELVRSVGGWRDFPWSEDWDLWLRCYLADATIEAIPAAVYRAYVRADSRNRSPSRAARLAAHRAIATANGIGDAPESPASGPGATPRHPDTRTARSPVSVPAGGCNN